MIESLFLAAMILYIEGSAAPPTLAMTFEDDFSGDIDGWDHQDGAGACTLVTDDLRTDQGVCDYDGVGSSEGEGPQPTSRDQWGYVEFGAASLASGPALRRIVGTTDHSNTEYWFVAEYDNNTINLRLCDGETNEQDCFTFHEFTNGGNDAGRGIIFAIAGEDGSTEFAVWNVTDTDGNAYDECDPSAWPVADNCISNDGTISNSLLLDVHCDGVTGETWDASPDSENPDWPAAGQTDVGYMNTHPSQLDQADRICGGTL